MTGIIILWYGALLNIPPGWALCDGTGGRPNLRDSIPVGAGSSYSVFDTGGQILHPHGFTSNGHTHTLPAGAAISTGGLPGIDLPIGLLAGNTDNGDGLPPYKSLCYIQKVA